MFRFAHAALAAAVLLSGCGIFKEADKKKKSGAQGPGEPEGAALALGEETVLAGKPAKDENGLIALSQFYAFEASAGSDVRVNEGEVTEDCAPHQANFLVLDGGETVGQIEIDRAQGSYASAVQTLGKGSYQLIAHLIFAASCAGEEVEYPFTLALEE